ncbi:PR-1-like protein [Suhomyces tanzawaensis NRRL Y-17324]|uniref:PR-1-like protein n=1 Tax=Suhomyces tanzawaensis NRRL Y-17324 TaxID=984487 RepID=A0A1E4SN94_9ASCO|nr:PR-1-like protein [Suhomyces tanzawaensis NRRL Y-17324]ODV80991.1 PR-1-like protein [Suhomyces tanzawaensis NRRL Y-17324]
MVYVQQRPHPSPSDTFKADILDLHNRYRLVHRAQHLHWNDTVEAYAESFASRYLCSGVLEHSGGPYGENLAIGYTTTGAVDAWYEEGAGYDYGSESTYNHFTAMIWNSSSSLGCATHYCNSVWGTYIVCSYYPAGNVVGYSSVNVFRPN